MKRIRIVLALFLVVLTCAGCASSGVQVSKPNVDYPPYCEAFLNVVGQSVQEVISAVGLTVEDFQDDTKNGWYILKEPVEYMGLSFEMRISVAHHGEEDKRYAHAICYLNRQEDVNIGAETVIDLRDKLVKGYGKPYNPFAGKKEQEKRPLEGYDKDALFKLFAEKENGHNVGLDWLLSVDVDKVPKEVMDDYKLPPTCITAALRTSYPVIENEKTFVLTRLDFGLSNSYQTEQ